MLKTKIICKQYKEIKEGSGVYNLDIKNELKRDEAIKCMAKAVYDTFSGCAHITPFEQVEDKYKQGYYKRAECALNGLLGANK